MDAKRCGLDNIMHNFMASKDALCHHKLLCCQLDCFCLVAWGREVNWLGTLRLTKLFLLSSITSVVVSLLCLVLLFHPSLPLHCQFVIQTVCIIPSLLGILIKCFLLCNLVLTQQDEIR